MVMPFSLLLLCLGALLSPVSAKLSLDAVPYAKITVVARGSVCPLLVRQHVKDMKRAVGLMLRDRIGSEHNIPVEIRRCEFGGEEAAISTSVIMSMTTEAGHHQPRP